MGPNGTNKKKRRGGRRDQKGASSSFHAQTWLIFVMPSSSFSPFSLSLSLSLSLLGTFFLFCFVPKNFPLTTGQRESHTKKEPGRKREKARKFMKTKCPPWLFPLPPFYVGNLAERKTGGEKICLPLLFLLLALFAYLHISCCYQRAIFLFLGIVLFSGGERCVRILAVKKKSWWFSVSQRKIHLPKMLSFWMFLSFAFSQTRGAKKKRKKKVRTTPPFSTVASVATFLLWLLTGLREKNTGNGMRWHKKW